MNAGSVDETYVEVAGRWIYLYRNRSRHLILAPTACFLLLPLRANATEPLDALTRAGVAPGDIHVDHASGAKALRPRLDLVLRLLRAGDTLVITRLDRLGRSVLYLVTLAASLREHGIGLRVVEQGIDTSTVEGSGDVRDALGARRYLELDG